MTFSSLWFFFVGVIVCLLSGIFAITSIRESRPRAAIVAAICLAIFVCVWFGSYFILSLSALVLWFAVALVMMITLLFIMPIGTTGGIEIGEITGRADERDIMFAREEYQPGTDKYETYYAMRPENREIDDKIRSLPELLAPGGRYYDPIRSPYADSIFKVIRELIDKVDGRIAPSRTRVDTATITDQIKKMILHLGADEVGIAPLNSMFVYSHVGRGPEPWGAPITNNHKFAIAFTTEMDYRQVEAAPRVPITEESAAKYLKGAAISISLAQFIRDLGYPARAHISGSNYQIMLPPVAHDAGLGELGRHGYLISPRFGSRIRLGAVTTDLPLLPDKPIKFGVQEFCEKCRRCAISCPSGSIPKGGKSVVRGVNKWPLEVATCFKYWRLIGTDCGLCMKVCPFSHPPSFLHNFVRSGIKRSAFARRLSIWGEDVVYGKKVKSEY